MANQANGVVQKKRKNSGDARDLQKKKLRKELYRVPNVEEMNKLQTVERSQNLNFFLLQIDELLKETRVKEKRAAFIDGWIEKLEAFLLGLESEEEKRFVADLDWPNEDGISVPINFDDVPFDASIKCSFQFLKPAAVFVSGAWRQSTALGASQAVHVCVELPERFFQKADHSNGVYHRKRALYLSRVALKLQNWAEVAECAFSYLHNDPLQPVLVVKPPGKHVTFKIRVVGSGEAFKLERFAPEKSNVKHLRVGKKKGKTLAVAGDEQTPTPHYNSEILRDLTAKRNEDFLSRAIAGNQNVRNAIVLLKVWSRQRGFDRGYGRLSSHVLSMFVAQLIQSGRISTAMSSYQIVRQVWVHLSTTAWNEAGKSVSLCREESSAANQPSLEDFHRHFDVVFVDPSGLYNLCANVSLDLYLRIKRESSIALKLLNEERSNTFRLLFATKYPTYVQFDHIVKLTANLRESIKRKGEPKDSLDFAGYWYPHVQRMLFSVLRKGLGQRIRALVPVEPEETPNWPIDAKCASRDAKLEFGLILDPEFAFDVLNKGPQSNLPEAEEYRAFWGSKSELRRFRDG